jgi:hypothetical protein
VTNARTLATETISQNICWVIATDEGEARPLSLDVHVRESCSRSHVGCNVGCLHKVVLFWAPLAHMQQPLTVLHCQSADNMFAA